MHASYTLCHSLVWSKSAKHSALVWFDTYQLYAPLQFCLVQVTYALHSLLFLMHVSYTLCYSCGLMSDSLIFGCQPYWVLFRSRLVWCNTASQLHMWSSLILCMSAFTLSLPPNVFYMSLHTSLKFGMV